MQDGISKTLDKSVLIGLALLVALLLFNAVLGYRNTRQLDEDAGWVSHTNQVLDLTNGYLLALTEAEAAQRGYLLTGKDDYLQSYDQTRERVYDQSSKLRAQTIDNPIQQERLARLKELTSKRLERLDEGIEIRRRDEGASHAFVATGVGRVQMDSIRELIGEMR